jgi:hypothetical protein
MGHTGDRPYEKCDVIKGFFLSSCLNHPDQINPYCTNHLLRFGCFGNCLPLMLHALNA